MLAFLGAACPVAAAESITFETPASDGADPVRAWLAVPVEPGPHPGVLLVPECPGQRPHQRQWTRTLAERGYVVLVVDHYFMHDQGRSCDFRDQAVDLAILQSLAPSDSHGALAWIPMLAI